MDIPSRKTGQRPFSFAFMFNAHDRTSLGRQGLGLSFSSLDAGLLIHRDNIISRSERYSLPLLLVQIPNRPCLAENCGSRANIQLRYCHGLMASSLSYRQIVIPLILATIPCSKTCLFSSSRLKRDSGMPSREGSSHASALTATTILGGETGQAARIWTDRTSQACV